MCGIVGAIARRDVAPILLEGLKRLEYRGYDSAGLAVLTPSPEVIGRVRAQGKVQQLELALQQNQLLGNMGIAHTRWATHGIPSEHNAHPHISNEDIALVHNGIIENHDALRNSLTEQGYHFSSDTDTEVAVHCVHHHFSQNQNLLEAVAKTTQELHGAFAFGIFHKSHPNELIAVRRGSPLVIGIGQREFFIASDVVALLPVAQKFIYLEDGDIARLTPDGVEVFNSELKPQTRQQHRLNITDNSIDRGSYRHFMLKEIFEQPQAISDTIEGRISHNHLLEQCFGIDAVTIFDQVENIHIIACGTSYHAGLVARYWLESMAGIPCNVEIASEFRYRDVVVPKNTLFVTISQSGETADTLAALQKAKQLNYLSELAICNVPESSLVRESNLVFMTRAGTEIGVASTKAFTTQLVSLLMLALALGHHNKFSAEAEVVEALMHLPQLIEDILRVNNDIKNLAKRFADKQHALFLGRGLHYPIAMEGALKLKEISYIHAEAYPAGELKHGPLALVDDNMPVVAIAPSNELLEKLKSNLHEVEARGGELIIFSEDDAIATAHQSTVIQMPSIPSFVAPIAYTIPLQLLAYHVAVLKGTDVDQPRNLAKSVTVE